MLSANTEHLDNPAQDDAARRPAPLAEIAQRLAAPPETVRRHAVGLLEAGPCRRVRGG